LIFRRLTFRWEASSDREAFWAAKVDAIRALAKNVVRDVIEIGRHLSEAKGKFGRGDNPEFLVWAKDALGWSQTSVYRFLNLHDLPQRDDFTNLAKCDLDLSALYLLAATAKKPDAPPEIIAEVEERVGRGEKPKVADVQQMLRERAFGEASGEVHRISSPASSRRPGPPTRQGPCGWTLLTSRPPARQLT
jgi:hypothetical protein